MSAHSQSSASGLLLTVAAFIIVVAGLRAAEPLLVPFLLSVFIAIIAAPPVSWLRERHWPLGLALAAVISVVLLAGLATVALVSASVTDFSSNLPDYQARLREQTAGLFDWLATFGLLFPGNAVLELVDPGAAMKMAAKVLNGLGSVLANSFLIFLTVVFMLLEAEHLPAKMARALADPAAVQRLQNFARNVKQYMVIKSLMSLATGGVLALWLAIIGVDYPLLWGLLAFLFNFVPNIGSIIAAVPAVLLAVVQAGPGVAVLAMSGYLVVNIVVGQVIEPRYMGRGLGLSTLVVFLSLVFWGWLLGPVGMLLSVPLTMLLKIGLDARQQTRGISILLGP